MFDGGYRTLEAKIECLNIEILEVKKEGKVQNAHVLAAVKQLAQAEKKDMRDMEKLEFRYHTACAIFTFMLGGGAMFLFLAYS